MTNLGWQTLVNIYIKTLLRGQTFRNFPGGGRDSSRLGSVSAPVDHDLDWDEAAEWIPNAAL